MDITLRIAREAPAGATVYRRDATRPYAEVPSQGDSVELSDDGSLPRKNVTHRHFGNDGRVRLDLEAVYEEVDVAALDAAGFAAE